MQPRILLFTNFFISSILFYTPTFAVKGYKIRQIKITCTEIDETRIRFDRCDIKAKRGTGGLLNIIIHYKGLAEMNCHLQMFYRGTSGKYQPFLIDFTFSACNTNKHEFANQIKMRFYKLCQGWDPDLIKGCPLHGPFNITNYDFDQESGKFYPPILATGVFMIQLRAYDNSNVTLFDIKSVMETKAVGIQDFINIG